MHHARRKRRPLRRAGRRARLATTIRLDYYERGDDHDHDQRTATRDQYPATKLRRRAASR